MNIMQPTIRTQRELRRAFWAAHPDLPRRRLRDGGRPTDVRVTFCDWLDAMRGMGWIDADMVQRATLGWSQPRPDPRGSGPGCDPHRPTDRRNDTMELKTLKDCDRAARALGLRRASGTYNGLPCWTDNAGNLVTRTALQERALDLSTPVARSEDRPVYNAPSLADLNDAAHDDAIIQCALDILRKRAHRGDAMTSPRAVRDYLTVRAAGLDVEVFAIVLLDAQNRVIETRDLFRGTLTQAAVYPREVVRACLEANAAAVILTHNHPSGLAEPSAADRLLTENLKISLSHIDVTVLDHIITAGGASCSFAERGWI